MKHKFIYLDSYYNQNSVDTLLLSHIHLAIAHEHCKILHIYTPHIAYETVWMKWRPAYRVYVVNDRKLHRYRIRLRFVYVLLWQRNGNDKNEKRQNINQVSWFVFTNPGCSFCQTNTKALSFSFFLEIYSVLPYIYLYATIVKVANKFDANTVEVVGYRPLLFVACFTNVFRFLFVFFPYIFVVVVVLSCYCIGCARTYATSAILFILPLIHCGKLMSKAVILCCRVTWRMLMDKLQSFLCFCFGCMCIWKWILIII